MNTQKTHWIFENTFIIFSMFFLKKNIIIIIFAGYIETYSIIYLFLFFTGVSGGGGWLCLPTAGSSSASGFGSIGGIWHLVWLLLW